MLCSAELHIPIERHAPLSRPQQQSEQLMAPLAWCLLHGPRHRNHCRATCHRHSNNCNPLPVPAMSGRR